MTTKEPKAPRRSRNAKHTGSFADLLAGVQSDLDDLHEEIDSWLQGLPENLQSGSKAEELQTCLDQLDAARDAAASAESALEDLEGDVRGDVTYYQDERKGRNSRADRLWNVSAIVSALVGAVEAAKEKVAEGEEDEFAVLADALNDIENECGSVEFPGMY